MDLITYRKYFLGTAKLLQLTEGLDEEKQKELLSYIIALETTIKNSQEKFQILSYALQKELFRELS